MTIEQFLNLLFSLSLSGSIVFIIWKLASPYLQKKVTKRVQYYLLLIVLFRFLLPVTAEYSLIGAVYPSLEATSVYELIFGEANSASPIFVGENVVVGNNVVLGSVRTPVDQYLFYIWLIAAFFLLVQKITKYQSFIKYIKSDWMPVDDPEILDLLSTICEEKKITAPIELYTTPLVSSPLLLGIRKSSIILPHTNLTKVQLHHILTHELSHFKSRDLLYKWFMQLILCIHWFNPLVYYINKIVNQECEYACDELSTRGMTKEERYDYGMTLIEMTRHTGTYKEKTAAVTLYENPNEIQNRLKVMLDSQKMRPPSLAFITFIGLILIGIALFTGAYNIFQEKDAAANASRYTQDGSPKTPSSNSTDLSVGRHFLYQPTEK
ncbi:M56 family metallopeptidase [Enterococcus sp. BWM-S5]|uniref:M56 family metallopeptidase n=1 Tax=Enterococcus larvae TaxID=2794352 RepID=A0ABS4CJZ8_9ENTE|nr:M56 family metallopeptidase [Enterococcus larvae]MBP1046934.1 M56 family metallopeptidase [Enterococcus larvae]